MAFVHSVKNKNKKNEKIAQLCSVFALPVTYIVCDVG
jgi:hypothetical protein